MTSKQLGVGIAYPDGNTAFHPCESDAEAWDRYAEIKAANPQATVWVGIQQSDGNEETP
ncbi:hypothetical protein [Streptomyces sp. NPDC008240]|uniref:hypothetical protein n=1 Tax=Streptomyces sp. NPDC008240 TaxID=3364822 RepID=UPI0036E39938